MKQPCISIIMPVYNAQRTLKKAVHSILSQSMPDFELVLVDDGSQDGSAETARCLAAADARIRLYCQENRGISAARNLGLHHATGQYLTFCDDDDMLLQGALEKAWQLAKETGADVVRTGYRLLRARQDGAFAVLPHKPGHACSYRQGVQGSYATFLRESGPQFVWNALYRRKAIHDILFEDACRSGLEDFVFNAAVYANIRTAVYDPFVGYVHYETAASTSSCRDTAAVGRRMEALPRWAEAEYKALCHCCAKAEQRRVWNSRKAEFITFVMHQLRDANAAPTLCSTAWRTLRSALHQLPYPALDICALAGQNRKQIAALLLYTLRLQGLYNILPNREVHL